MWEPVMSIQCGLQHSSQPSAVVLLISKSIVLAVNGTTGKEPSRADFCAVSCVNNCLRVRTMIVPIKAYS